MDNLNHLITQTPDLGYYACLLISLETTRFSFTSCSVEALNTSLNFTAYAAYAYPEDRPKAPSQTEHLTDTLSLVLPVSEAITEQVELFLNKLQYWLVASTRAVHHQKKYDSLFAC